MINNTIIMLQFEKIVSLRLINPISDLDYNRPRRYTTWTGKIRKDKNGLYLELNENTFPL